MDFREAATGVGIIGGSVGLIAVLHEGFIAPTASDTLYGLVVLVAPIVGLAGAGAVAIEPLLGSGLMAVSGVGGFLALGELGVHMPIDSIVSAFILLVGAVLGIIGKFQS